VDRSDDITKARILDEWVPEPAFAKANGISPRTVARYRKEKNGLPYSYMGGRVVIHLPSAREWLMKRLIRPNSTRSARAGQ
jgi:hypothetical protein